MESLDEDWERIDDWEDIEYIGGFRCTHFYTYRNKKTGKTCEQSFDECTTRIKEGFAVVRLPGEEEETYFNPNTGKICSHSFNMAFLPSEGLAAVWLLEEDGGKWTYFNPSTDELIKERFDNGANDIHEGFGVVGLGVLQRNKKNAAYFSPSTHKLCKKRFERAEDIHEGFGAVKIDDKWTIFIPKTEFVFSARFEKKEDASLAGCLRNHPEEFVKVPTAQFRDKDLIEKCLDSMAEGVKGLCSKKGSTKEVEDYTSSIIKMIQDKIELEKKNIEIEDKKLEKEKIEGEKKAEIAENAATNIKNLGREL